MKKKKIDTSITIPKTIKIVANKEHLYIFLSNIIGNAIKYNKPGGKIILTYKKEELTIIDNGVGIDKNNISKIFDRFYKIDKSRNSEGFGIGLSLVKKISKIYNWKLTVDSEIGNGTKFKIKF